MATPTQTLSNPFPGLRAFEVTEDYLFFGREPQTAELVKRLRQSRFLAVVGTSGSGKSSLVRAGMIPTLLGGRMMKAGSRWEIAVTRPGGHPIAHLAKALCDAELYDPGVDNIVPHLQATLSRSRLGLVEAVRQSEIEPDTNLLLVVDQFEELFRFRGIGLREREEALDFVNLLLEATRQKDPSIYVVITMRSDFIGDCSQFEGLAEAVNGGEFLIPRLSRPQCRAAIEGPLKVAGGRITSRLVQRLLNDLGEDQDELPILQHALMRTWNHGIKRARTVESTGRDDTTGSSTDSAHAGLTPSTPTLDVEDYEATGGMSEALSRHADEVFESLPESRHRLVAERLFQALTERGSDNRGIRRPTRLRQLCEIGAAEASEVALVIEAFRAPGVTFLMPPVRIELRADTVIDISHESLMRVWRRLNRWVEDEARSARIYARLADSAHLHQEGKAGLYRDPDLQIALSWREAHQPTEAWSQRYHEGFQTAVAFLEESRQAQQRALAEKEAASQRELEQAQALAEAQRWRLEEQQRLGTRLKWLVRGLGLVTMVALAALFVALTSSRLARDNEERAEQNADEARRQAERAQEQRQLAESATRESRRQIYQSDMNLAAQAYAAGDIARLNGLLEKHWPEPWDTEDLRGFEWYHWWQAAHLHIAQPPPVGPLGSLAVSADQKLYAVIGYPGVTWVRYTVDDREVTPMINRGGATLAFTLDGRFLVLGGSDRLTLFDTTTWIQREVTAPGGGNLHALAFSPSEPLMSSGGDGDAIVFWNTKTWEPVGQPLQPEGFVRSLAFTADGQKLVAAMDDSRVVVWDLESRTVAQVLTGHAKSVRSVVHSPVDNLFATGSSDETVRLWNGDFELLGAYDAFGPVTRLEFSPDGQKLIAGTSINNSLLVWKLEEQPLSLNLVHVIKGHSREVRAVAFLKGTNTIMSISEDGFRKTWDLSRSEPSVNQGQLQVRASTRAGPNRLTYSPDGRRLWVTDSDGNVYWSRLDSPGLVEPPDPDGFRTLAVTKDGAWLAGATEDGHLGVWDVRKGVLLARHPTSAAEVDSVVVSLGGPTVAWKTESDVHIWNVNNNTTRALGMAMAGFPDVSSSGERVVAHEWETTRAWDITVDPPFLLWSRKGWGPEFCSVFSPGGDRVAAASFNNDIRIHDAQTGDLVATLKGHTAPVLSVDFSRNGRRLVSGGEDHTVRIWDVEAGQLLSSFINYGMSVASVAFSPTEDSVASLSDDGTVKVWTSSTVREVNQHLEHWIGRANTYRERQLWNQALASLDEGLKHNPDSLDLLLARSDVHRQKGEWSAASSDIARAIAVAPTNGLLFKQRADLLVEQRRRSDAVADYVQAITLAAELRDWNALERIRDSLSLGPALVPTASEWRYTTTDPGENWHDPDQFDDLHWQLGEAPFGAATRDAGPDSKTLWGRPHLNIWLRLSFDVSQPSSRPPVFRAYVDDEVHIYLNGVLAAEATWIEHRYQILRASENASLRPGRNVLAVHARNQEEVAKVDVGLYQQADGTDFEEVLSRARMKLPSDLQLLRSSGMHYSSQHRWSEALASYRNRIELSPDNEQDWMRAAALYIAAGDLEGYHRLCAEMLERFQAPGAQEIAERVAKACLFVPPADANLPAAVELARKSVADPTYWVVPYALSTRGLADYREGNFPGAKGWLQKALAEPPMWFVEVQAHLVMAMSEYQLKETKAAQTSLQQAKSVMNSQAPNYRAGTLGNNWHDWLYSQALLREAEALLRDE